ncbi:hypothetical protein A1356_22680 [Methylomonas koyamae]|uniref:Uncharacterized protein n=2 Tax=Methylomonas koyamae TaxID=702114 RepID=A0AA91DG70_9GAMM|nr:hypothetical protein A1356_22680 [Methylomonas koyamae]
MTNAMATLQGYRVGIYRPARRRPREYGDPAHALSPRWIPAFAGMTDESLQAFLKGLGYV